MVARNRIIVFILVAVMLIGIASCGADNSSAPRITEDREGNPITLPDKIDTIITMGPSNTEILVALGFGDIIVAIDEYSENVVGIMPGIPMFSMLAPDGEQIINLMPDIVFVPGMSRRGGTDDPFKVVSDVGICVIYMPSSDSIEDIKEDIRYIAAIMDAMDRAEGIIAGMEREIDRIAAIGATITDRRTVYFEVSAAPWIVSFGSGVFLNEMIELIGAVNVFKDREGWMSLSDEIALAADPDVILTSVNYLDDPIEEIKSRPGWSGVAAVRDGAVFYIDTDSSNRPSHNIVIALLQMAQAVYPDVF